MSVLHPAPSVPAAPAAGGRLDLAGAAALAPEAVLARLGTGPGGRGATAARGDRPERAREPRSAPADRARPPAAQSAARAPGRRGRHLVGGGRAGRRRVGLQRRADPVPLGLVRRVAGHPEPRHLRHPDAAGAFPAQPPERPARHVHARVRRRRGGAAVLAAGGRARLHRAAGDLHGRAGRNGRRLPRPDRGGEAVVLRAPGRRRAGRPPAPAAPEADPPPRVALERAHAAAAPPGPLAPPGLVAGAEHLKGRAVRRSALRPPGPGRAP